MYSALVRYLLATSEDRAEDRLVIASPHSCRVYMRTSSTGSTCREDSIPSSASDLLPYFTRYCFRCVAERGQWLTSPKAQHMGKYSILGNCGAAVLRRYPVTMSVPVRLDSTQRDSSDSFPKCPQFTPYV